jgi:hypothetical protein
VHPIDTGMEQNYLQKAWNKQRTSFLFKVLSQLLSKVGLSLGGLWGIDIPWVKGKCALGPFLSILVIECQHKCLSVNLCQLMDKVQIKSKGIFLRLSTLF